MANPEKIAPATKYGGKIVVCQPGTTDVAKSMDTMVWTDNTSGVERPARIKATDSYRIHVLAPPSHPKLNALYICARVFAPILTARSRITAKSGMRPMYQNTSETEKYVE